MKIIKLSQSDDGQVVGPAEYMPEGSKSWGTRYAADDGYYLVYNEQFYWTIDTPDSSPIDPAEIEEVEDPDYYALEVEAKARAWDIVTGEGN